jgi:hypothetical protein
MVRGRFSTSDAGAVGQIGDELMQLLNADYRVLSAVAAHVWGINILLAASMNVTVSATANQELGVDHLWAKPGPHRAE